MLEDGTAQGSRPSSTAQARPLAPPMRLPALAWLIVALAALDAINWIQAIADALGTVGNPLADWSIDLPVLGGAIEGAAAVLPVLLPAALLYRIPNAARTQRVLLGGLSAGATIELVRRLALPLLPPPSTIDALAAQQTVTAGLLGVLGIVGPLLIGLGLAHLRGPRPPARPAEVALLALLGVAWVIEVASAGVPVATQSRSSGPLWTPMLVSTVLGLVAAPCFAFQLWVPLTAWRDRRAPAPFWRLLGLASLGALLSLVFALVVNLGTANVIAWPGIVEPGNSGGPLISTVAQAFLAVSVLLALAAYGWHAPAPGDGAPPGGD
jgi:hypothetical protein